MIPRRRRRGGNSVSRPPPVLHTAAEGSSRTVRGGPGPARPGPPNRRGDRGKRDSIMTSRTIRVTVRGYFDKLSEAQTAELVGEAAEHDFLHTAYPPEGYLAYDVPARPFF